MTFYRLLTSVALCAIIFSSNTFAKDNENIYEIKAPQECLDKNIVATKEVSLIDLIKIGFDNLKIEGEVVHDEYTKKYQIAINRFEKKVYINNFPIKKIAEYISNFCVTSFLPNDMIYITFYIICV